MVTSDTRPLPQVLELRTQLPDGLIGIDAGPVRLSWKVSSEVGAVQDGYEVDVQGDALFFAFANPFVGQLQAVTGAGG